MWFDGRMVSYDTETTGVDLDEDRIVTAAIVATEPAADKDERRGTSSTSWLLDPSIEISADATAVHGITTEHAVQNGMDAWDGIEQIANVIRGEIAAGTPIVVYNAPFDLTMLDRECRRYGIEVPDWESALVFDPLVVGKWLDRFRRGHRRLLDVCAHYRVPLDAGDAHGAEADALASLRLAWVIATRANYVAREQHQIIAGRSQWKAVRGDLRRLQDFQAACAADQARGLRSYFEGRGEAERAASVREDWPLVPWPES